MDKLAKLGKMKGKLDKLGKLMQSAQNHLQQNYQYNAAQANQSPPPPPQPYGHAAAGPSQGMYPPAPAGQAMLVNCTRCKTALQLPPNATAIRCAVCQEVVLIAPQQGPPQQGPPQPPRQQTLFGQGPPHGGQPMYPPGPASMQYGPPPGPAPMQYGPPAGPAPVQYGPPAGPATVQYSPSLPSMSGSRKAVIVGITYAGSKYSLKGCINDAKCMKYMLTNKFNFNEQNIIMLTEEEKDRDRYPTKVNIMRALYWLMRGVKAGDSLVFHYSGHGSQQVDKSGDEVDGYDETLCPVDFERAGMIVDDDLNTAIVRPLPPGAKLHAVVDACHSGTVLDLPFLCKINRHGSWVWEDHRPKRNKNSKNTSGGEAFCFSGCDDSQTSADTAALSKVTSTGAMTYCFIDALEKGRRGQTYGEILMGMRQAIKAANEKMRGPPAVETALSVIDLFFGGPLRIGGGGGLTQIPQLTASEAFDMMNKPFCI